MKNKPDIRFDGFIDDWELCQFKNIVDVRSGRDYKHLNEGDIPVYGTGGYMLSVDESLSKNEDAVGIGRKGTIDKPYLLKAPFWTVDTLFYAIPRKNYVLEFVHSIFNTINWRKYDESTGVPSLSKSTINSVICCVPVYKEQTQIGAFFQSLDNLITLHQRELENYKLLKKGFLQKLFPSNGDTNPSIRFDGFTDAWEQRRLGELAESFEYGLNASSKEYDGKNKYLRITDIDDNSRQFRTESLTSPNINLDLAKNYILKNGDILFARTGASVGKTYKYNEIDGLVYYAGFLIRTRIKKDVNAEFIFQNTLTDNYQNYIKVTSQRSGQPGVNAHEYAKFEIMVPKQSEQNQIGTFFQNLDSLITLHQRELDNYKELKKGFLQKMFV